MESSVSVPSDQNIRDHLWMWSTLTWPPVQTEICLSIWTNRFIAFLLFTCVGNLKKGITEVKSHSSWLARFDRKMFHFSQILPLVSDRSVWHNEKHPRLTFRVKNCEELELTTHILNFGIEFWFNILSFQCYRYSARLWLLTGSWKTWKVLEFCCGIF